MEPFYHNLTFNDFDDFTASVTRDLELKQLSEGEFRADLIFFGDLDIQLGKTLYSNGFIDVFNSSLRGPGLSGTGSVCA